MEEYVHLSLETYNKLMEDNKVLKAFLKTLNIMIKMERKLKVESMKEKKKL